MIPSISRIVHFVMPEGFRNTGEHRAAIITNLASPGGDAKVTEQTPVSLTIFLDGSNEAIAGTGGYIFRDGVHQDPTGKARGTWHEPERVG